MNKNYDDYFDYSYGEQKTFVNFEWKYYSNRLYYKKYKYNLSFPVKKMYAINFLKKIMKLVIKKKCLFT